MLGQIRGNIEKLIAMYEAAKAENASLKEDIKKSNIQIEDYRKQILELRDQIDNLKMREAFLAGTVNGDEAKARIDRMIKEIDKCISLLEA